MCSAAINLGPEHTDAQLFAEAITRFDKAVDAATPAGDPTLLTSRCSVGRVPSSTRGI